MLKKIKISNFKSYKEIEILFNEFNLILGVNASGKSNLLQALTLLKVLKDYDLEETIAILGGKFFRNINTKSNRVTFEFIFEPKTFLEKYKTSSGNSIVYSIDKVEYKLELINTIDADFRIDNESIKFYATYKEVELNKADKSILKDTILYSFDWGLVNINGQITKFPKTKKKYTYEDKEEEFYDIIIENPIPDSDVDFAQDSTAKKSILKRFKDYLPSSIFKIDLFDFDLVNARNGEKKEPHTVLLNNASNLQVRLDNILENKEKKSEFLDCLQYILNFVEDIKSGKEANSSISGSFEIKENYTNKFIPSKLLSDGTVNVTAIIAALLFQDNKMVIYEEPDKGLHPSVIKKLINTFKDEMDSKQIFVTTHNPLLVKYAKLEDLILVLRNEKGFTEIIKPSESETVKRFLENELELDYLFTQNLLDE